MSPGSYQQATSPMRVTSPLGPDVLLAKRLHGTEQVSVPFRFTLDLVSINWEIDPDDLLGKPLVTTIESEDGVKRIVHGLVRRFAFVGNDREFALYRAEIVPWLALLSLSSDCRIFQRLTAQGILEKIFREHGATDFSFSLSKSHAEREYCVMFRETYLDFVCRLMDEEGMSYCFRHTEGHHEMVITDDLAATMSEAVLPLRMSQGEVPGEAEDVVLTLEREGAVVTGRVTLSDYDFVKPKVSLQSSSEGKGTGELYHYPGDYLTTDEGEAIALRLLEGRELPRDLVRGTSACPRLACGTRFALHEHTRSDYNQEYRVLELTHKAEFGGWRSADEPGAFRYRSSFLAIPSEVPYRPRRIARKPLVTGLQSAVVVGKAGEEIWTDKYGRVKLQFHWDRLGNKNEDSSCWVRVSSLWAGKNWGAVQLPRIGQEVLVEFLDGDVDRPIVTGRVYNDDQMPPYALPNHQTQSGLKTRSTKKGDPANANELRFEDMKGEEQVLLHAERDLVVEVEHDSTTTVDHDEKLEVGNNETVTIKHNRTDEVQGDETRKVVGKRSVKVMQSDALEVMQDRTEKVTQSIEVQAGMTITLKAGMELKLESPGGTITIGPAGISIQSPTMVTVKGPMVMIN